jgi:hypothetical protein
LQQSLGHPDYEGGGVVRITKESGSPRREISQYTKQSLNSKVKFLMAAQYVILILYNNNNNNNNNNNVNGKYWATVAP